MAKIVSATTKYNTRSTASGKPMTIVERIWKLSRDVQQNRVEAEIKQQDAHDAEGRMCARLNSKLFICTETGEVFEVESLADRRATPKS
jgi:hypothetical protein